MHRHDQDPSAAAWLIALVSLALPWIGIGLGIVGVWTAGRGDATGWWMIGAGCAVLIADVVIDFVWAHPSISRSDQPDLNRRTAQFVGRVLVLEEAIEGGRGKVRVGDTLWSAEGPDTPAGSRVRVTAVRGHLLVVEEMH
ncbi:MAG: NfeD family protein [Hyphomicrobiaceae bacterium]|nr:MAG: NfeD family protein [Hyphomicrobiaceae bacterium]